ncbi:MAG TPA: nuclear transport factor 2 family protein [Segetibacter sp.]
MNKNLMSLAFLLMSAAASGQTSADSVKMVIGKMFTAMKTGDSSLLTSCFADSAILQTVAKSKAGTVYIRNEGIRDFAKQIVSLPKGDADERITFDIVKVDADLAIAWTPYQFYFKGNFSHCGVNSFQLVRLNGEWKIQYIIDTRRKDNCIESRSTKTKK